MKTKEESIAALQPHAHTPMGQLLISLFQNELREAVPGEPETYAVAAQVVLAASNYATAGALAVESSGLLRMVQPGMIADPNFKHKPPRPILANHYFTVHAIGTLVVIRNVPETKQSTIVMG